MNFLSSLKMHFAIKKKKKNKTPNPNRPTRGPCPQTLCRVRAPGWFSSHSRRRLPHFPLSSLFSLSHPLSLSPLLSPLSTFSRAARAPTRPNTLALGSAPPSRHGRDPSREPRAPASARQAAEQRQDATPTAALPSRPRRPFVSRVNGA
jgi:hypothetical protein